MILLLDTTVLIDVLRGKRGRRTLLAEMVGRGHLLSTTALNVGEVYRGMRSREESETELFLGELQCYEVTPAIGRHAGKLANTWSKRGRTLTLADMVVAATALEHGLTLMTDNRKDFPMPELQMLPLPPA